MYLIMIIKLPILNENKMEILAINDINKGEEIFVSYGDRYWDTRTLEKK